MANLSKIVDWVLPKISSLKMKISRVEWVDEWFPGYFDYRIVMPFNNETCIGRGIAQNEQLSFEKAITEVFERASVRFPEFKECPWATAGFPDLAGAQKRAYLELLGIDRALCHHFCKKRFKSLPISLLEEKVKIQNLRKNLLKNKIEFYLYELTPAKDARIVTAIAFGTNTPYPLPGFVAGFGCGEKLPEIALHAAFECLRTAVAIFIHGERPSEPLDLLRKRRSPWWHIWMALTRESREYFKKYLVPSDTSPENISSDEISISNVEFIEITTLKEIFPDIPLSFVQAKSDKLLRPQFGEFSADVAVLKRLNSFAGHPVVVDTTVPHFYG